MGEKKTKTRRLSAALAAALVVLAAPPARATTIVAVRTAKEIYIGADSKVTDTFGNAAAAPAACKIGLAGRVAFAYAGFARDAETGYSVRRIAAAALAAEPSPEIAEKAARMTRELALALETEVPRVRERSFVTYREKIEGRVFLRVLVAGFERGRPVLLVRQFRYGQAADGKIGVIVTNDDCAAGCDAPLATRFLGETAAIDGLPEETKDFWKAGFAAGVRRLIETEIAARDEYVGPPIDILRLSAKRAAWIQKKTLCDSAE